MPKGCFLLPLLSFVIYSLCSYYSCIDSDQLLSLPYCIELTYPSDYCLIAYPVEGRKARRPIKRRGLNQTEAVELFGQIDSDVMCKVQDFEGAKSCCCLCKGNECNCQSIEELMEKANFTAELKKMNEYFLANQLLVLEDLFIMVANPRKNDKIFPSNEDKLAPSPETKTVETCDRDDGCPPNRLDRPNFNMYDRIKMRSAVRSETVGNQRSQRRSVTREEPVEGRSQPW